MSIPLIGQTEGADMEEKLAGYEVIAGLIGTYTEMKNTTEIHLSNRVKLYDAVRQLCQSNPEKMGSFRFRQRRGRYTSDDVDIVLRNLEDSELLECLNPDLVVFRQKNKFAEMYSIKIKPKIESMNLMQYFQTAAENL